MIKVGCCGYPTAMKKYYENFGLVELNRTFYAYPQMSTVIGWREKAPADFEFTVKAHQDISHTYRFEIKPSVQAFEQMKQICKTLRARILLIQTPGSFRPDKLNDAIEFFGDVKRENLTVVWETRGPEWDKRETRAILEKALKTVDVPHVVDPLKGMPVYTSEIAYFRLHGMGKQLYYHQYSNEELKRLHKLVKPFERKGKTAYVLFNNLAMLDDAARFMQYPKTGVFPSLTGAVGLNSVRSIIEKTRYPTTKSRLSKRLGWRLVELDSGKQTPLDELIKKLPSKPYRSLEEILKEIERILRCTKTSVN